MMPPTSREEAIARGSAIYLDLDGTCETCKMVQPTYYVENNRCMNCARQKELEILSVDPFATYNRKAAIKMDEPGFYIPQRMCKKGPHLLYQSVQGRGCMTCKLLNEQRRSEGKTHYRPVQNCPKCGTRALRKKSDRKCTRCELIERAATPTQPVQPWPGDRTSARELGFKIYLQSKPCHRGHKTGRYVSNGMCVECTAINAVRRQVPFVGQW